jgi:hypothetical protein
MRGSGGYMDWYCCGPEANVSEFIARSMKKKGWIYYTSSEICDEPGCLKDAGCGWSAVQGNYRYTCSEHMSKHHVG